MGRPSVLDHFAAIDATWRKALDSVREHLPVPSSVSALFRQGWNMQLSPKEYFKHLSVSRLGTSCLIEAAELPAEEGQSYATSIDNSIQYLGVRYCSVVLAVGLVTRIVEKSDPPDSWNLLLSQMIANIEVGYKLGSRVRELGIEGGALVGFARSAGLAVLVLTDPEKFCDLLRHKNGLTDGKLQQKLFGFEAYQASSFVIQQLGFGHEVAYGFALASGSLQIDHIELRREVLRWRAAYEWIEALRSGRNYPGHKDVRSFFSEINPDLNGGRNLALDSLYAELSKIRTHGSSWIWHLPLQKREKLESSTSASLY